MNASSEIILELIMRGMHLNKEDKPCTLKPFEFEETIPSIIFHTRDCHGNLMQCMLSTKHVFQEKYV